MKLAKLTITGAAAALMLSTAPAAWANNGTTAGTEITNSISLSYRSGSQTIDVEDADSASFTVDRKVDFLVEEQVGGGITVDLGSGDDDDGASVTFKLDNLSNDDVEYAFDVTAPAGFSHDPDGGLNTYRLMIGGSAYTPGDPYEVGEDGEVTVELIVEFDPEIEGDEFDFSLTATPQIAESDADDIANLSTVSTVWLFEADDDEDSVTYTIIRPLVSATKDVAVVDQSDAFACSDMNAAGDGGAAIPGACVEYTITVTNNGNAAARDIVITDTLPAGLTYQNAAGAFAVIHAAGVVTATANDNLTNGSTETLRIRATID
jgi:uncharacterized repeat protein (TIGR01451 family)